MLESDAAATRTSGVSIYSHLIDVVCFGYTSCMILCMVRSHDIDSLLKLIFSNPNGLLTCYSM